MIKRLRVFVVDDDACARDALALLLRAVGWSVRAFGAASQCLDAIAHDLPDCVVTDLCMPGITGTDLVRTLRDRGVSVPAVLVTGMQDDTPLLARARNLRDLHLLRKPYGGEELLLTMAKAVSACWIRPTASAAGA